MYMCCTEYGLSISHIQLSSLNLIYGKNWIDITIPNFTL